MKTFVSISSLQKKIQKLKQEKKTIGFVPTMGALHEGHLSLVSRCRRENDIVVASIFVNPTQFGPNEDFRRYPREEKKDKFLLKKADVDIIFYPTEQIMYPAGYLTSVKVSDLGHALCGESRPGHFEGVTTVVTKLLNIVTPDKLYLGQKDAQQAVILSRMVKDLNFATQVVVCPTVRETDGLAMSSRNKYLNAQERKEAPMIYQTLKEMKNMILDPGSNTITPSKMKQYFKSRIKSSTSATIDYIQCVDAQTLKPLSTFKGSTMIAAAVQFASARLIDNVIFNVK